jgi:acetoin utilization protein AcuB
VSEDESLSLALQLMLWNEVRHLPVLRAGDGGLIGVISERDILHAHQLGNEDSVMLREQPVMSRPVREFMAHPPEHVHPEAELADAAADLSAKKLGCLLVVDGGALVGMLAVGDVLAPLAQVRIQEGWNAVATARSRRIAADTVASVMHPDPIRACPDDPLHVIAEKMLHAGVRHLPIVDGEERVLGIVSDRDLRRAVGDPKNALAVEQGPGAAAALARMRAQHVMTSQPRMLEVGEPIENAVDALLTQRFGALPVVDADQHLRGIVSYVDVLRYIATADAPARLVSE